jgi:hypothetical protein
MSCARPFFIGRIQLIFFGVTAAALFSATFLLNQSMSVAGGHWLWSAVLRFAFMTPILTALILFRGGWARLWQILNCYYDLFFLWSIAGGVGYGLFYGAICFAADHDPAWVIATTWQSTILATPLVLYLFGLPVPQRGVAFLILIFSGIIMVNVETHNIGSPYSALVRSITPVIVAAFAYPFGNQLLHSMRTGGRSASEHTVSSVMTDPMACVFLMTLGSAPFWIGALCFVMPPLPSQGQAIQALLVAIFSGVMATTLFVHARNSASDPFTIAAVDATQSAEVPFVLFGNVIFLSEPTPGTFGWGGLALITLGLLGFTLSPYSNNSSDHL